METTNRAIAVLTERRNNPDHRQNLRSWLLSRRGMMIVGASAAAAIAFAMSQQWLSARDLLPLLYLLPCAVMMAICAKGMGQCDSQGSAGGKPRRAIRPRTGLHRPSQRPDVSGLFITRQLAVYGLNYP